MATPLNVVPGTNPQRDALGLIAWIDVYGTLTVGDDMRALVVLAVPDCEPPPGRWNS